MGIGRAGYKTPVCKLSQFGSNLQRGLAPQRWCNGQPGCPAENDTRGQAASSWELNLDAITTAPHQRERVGR